MEIQHIKNLQDAAKALLNRKSIVIKVYIQKQNISQINNLSLLLQELEKEKQTKPKVSRRKEITKITAEINDIETRKSVGKYQSH